MCDELTEIKAVKRKIAREKDLEGIEMTNIITEPRGRRAASQLFSPVYRPPKPPIREQESESESERESESESGSEEDAKKEDGAESFEGIFSAMSMFMLILFEDYI